MNKSIYIFLLFAASIFFISCDSEAPRVSVTGISLNETQLTMTVGDPVVALIATVHPNDATNPRVRWESDDTDVAIVSFNGAVIALSAGTATITATTADGNFSATCEVTVTPALVHVLVTGVTLTNCNAATPLAVGNTRQLSATVAPADATNRTVAWASSNNDIATVSDNGLVTAVAAGRVTITATTECGSHTAVCEITVIPPIPVRGITITRTPIHLAIGAIDRFSFYITPYHATNQAVTWSSSSPNIATVDAVNGTITALATGETYITVTTQCGLYTATDLVSVTGEINISSDTYVRIGNTYWATRNLIGTRSFAQHPHDAGTFFLQSSLVCRCPCVPARDREPCRCFPCPAGWREPSPGQLRSLSIASRGWITLNGVNGRIFGARPGPGCPEEHIFLPAAGFHNTDGRIWDVGNIGYYWSFQFTGCDECDNECGRNVGIVEEFLRFDSRSSYVTRTVGVFGFSVRCVR